MHAKDKTRTQDKDTEVTGWGKHESMRRCPLGPPSPSRSWRVSVSSTPPSFLPLSECAFAPSLGQKVGPGIPFSLQRPGLLVTESAFATRQTHWTCDLTVAGSADRGLGPGEKVHCDRLRSFRYRPPGKAARLGPPGGTAIVSHDSAHSRGTERVLHKGTAGPQPAEGDKLAPSWAQQ